MPWGPAINRGKVYRDGVRLDCKMSAWELVGPLMVLTAGVEMVKGRSLVIRVDNAGSVSIFKKGWCTSCMLCTTLVLAISEVSASIHCRIEIVKIRRCSDNPSSAADAISKADWRRFRSLMPGADLEPAKLPVTLLKWVQDPVEDRTLGRRILREMDIKRSVFGDYKEYK